MAVCMELHDAKDEVSLSSDITERQPSNTIFIPNMPDSFKLVRGNSSPKISKDSLSKLQFGYFAIFIVASVVLCVEGTHSTYMSILVAMTTVLAVTWVDKAESHEGPDVPDSM
jgi:hypothetical protein